MNLEVDFHVGNRLRRRRRMLGLTQRELGAAVGVRLQQVQRYECGQNSLSAPRLWAVANVLGVPIEYFFEGLKPRNVEQDAAHAQ